LEQRADSFEYYFISNCYSSEINESKIYTLIVEKIISTMLFPYKATIPEFQKMILKKYSIEIPPTFLKEILQKIARQESAIQIRREAISIPKIPLGIEQKTSELQVQADTDSTLIFRSFNKYLENSDNTTITFKDFNELLKIYHDRLINDQAVDYSARSNVFYEWCNMVFASSNALELKTALNKIIYSWFIFYYFQSIKRKNKKLNGFQIVIDTNILVYLLGINGLERRNYVSYLLKKAGENNCSIVILNKTLNELIRLLDAQPNDEIRVFNTSHKDIRTQIKHNPEGLFNSLFRKFGLPVEYRSYQQNASSELIEASKKELHRYKNQRRRDIIVEQSIEHDIALLDHGNSLKKLNNIYESRTLVITTDGHLCGFAKEHAKNLFESYSTNVLVLEKASFIFWIETNKGTDDSFFGNTWLYISESLHYFTNHRIDVFYRNFRALYQDEGIVPSEWRSPYLLMEETIEEIGKPLDEYNNDDFEELIDKLKMTRELEVVELKKELLMQKEKIEELQSTKHEPKITQPININIDDNRPNKKSANDFTILELLIELFRKLGRLLRIIK
jgi:hypothetical protein